MGFQQIGPYRLTRADLIAASLAISFLTGSRRVRIWTGILVLIGLGVVGVGIASSDTVGVILGPSMLAFVFVIIPALRSRKGAGDIYLSVDPDGLVADTAKAKTLYKWATIQSFRKVGSRLFIMISGGCALVVADRTTTAENMADLIATLENHQAA